MTRRAFDRFMVANDNGRSSKLARFNDAEFRAIVQGVWPIASEATPRGAFLIGTAPATAEDIVFKAPKVKLRAAESALEKLRSMGMLEHDDSIGGEWVHDWDLINPSPRTDNTSAERQARYRERMKEQGVPLTIPAALRAAVHERDGWACVDCESTGELHIDHIIPKSKGGPTVLENLTVRCGGCNRAKGVTVVTPTSRTRDGDSFRVSAIGRARSSEEKEGEGKKEKHEAERAAAAITIPVAIPDESLAEDAHASERADALSQVVGVLRSCSRFTFDPMYAGVANMLAAHPKCDHMEAAYTAVARGADPTYRTTNGARAFEYALVDQVKRKQTGNLTLVKGSAPSAPAGGKYDRAAGLA